MENSVEISGDIEKADNPLRALDLLNEMYKNYPPQKRDSLISAHIDRGTKVTNSLRKILGPYCQICGEEGFVKRNGDKYIEAHHLVQLSLGLPSSLCTDNIILVCPNCHRELHHGRDVTVIDQGDYVLVRLSNREKLLNKNKLEGLKAILAAKEVAT
jgi:hypothetical protein